MKGDFTPGRPLRAYTDTGHWRDFSTDDLVGNDLNHFKDWKCAAGVRSLAIKPDGRMFVGTCAQGGKLGNVYSTFELPREWLTCRLERCTCGADLFIPKARALDNLTVLRKTFNHAVELNKADPSAEKFVGIERTHASNFKQVYWEVTHRCNYDCSYCTPFVHNKTDSFRPFHELARATERLCSQFALGEQMNFIISGGEPTLHPHFLDWVRMIACLGHHVSCHSNGSRLPGYYKELIRHADLNLSLHLEFWRAEKFYSVIEAVTVEKIKCAGKTRVGHLEVKIMMPPGQINIVEEIEQRLRAIEGFTSYCTWAVVPLRVGEQLLTVNEKYSAAEVSLFGDRTQASAD